MQNKYSSTFIKLALFATGLSGIVAEYVLSTLATYFLGNSTFQWTIVLSLMLFSMGLGSRLTRNINTNLAETFILAEWVLSILSGLSAITIYYLSSQTESLHFVIYIYCIAIGLLIGMEIPLAIRLNNSYETLSVNVSAIMENDYFGSLIGGIFFAFIGLPIIGISYTPILLGTINALVALIWVFQFKHLLNPFFKRFSVIISVCVLISLGVSAYFSDTILFFAEQKKYKDKVVFSEQTPYQKLVITEWQDAFWLYIDGNQQLSTLDEALYHEPLVHLPMQLSGSHQNILVLGGGDGCAVRELLKYTSVEKITVVDLDPSMIRIAKTHPVLYALNDSAFYDPKVEIINIDAWVYMQKTQAFYDAIIIDLPDPRSIELNRLYSSEFYSICKRRLRPNGVFITQAGSPYYAPYSFWSIFKTVRNAGFKTLIPFHNQIPTMGEWGFVMAISDSIPEQIWRSRLNQLSPEIIQNCAWLNRESIPMMTNFGNIEFWCDTSKVEVNTIQNPVTYTYFLGGRWSIY